MKKSFICTIVLLALVIVSSCKKDDKDDSATPEAKISMKIDGVEWITTKNIEAFYTDVNNVLQIAGAKDDPLDFIHISTLGYHVGTYPMNVAGNSGTYQLFSSIFDFSRDGEIVITSCDTVNNIVSGTFRFKGVNGQNLSSKQITEGKFENIKFTKESIEK